MHRVASPIVNFETLQLRSASAIARRTRTDLFSIDSDQRVDHHPVTDLGFFSSKIPFVCSNGDDSRRCDLAMETPNICEARFMVLFQESNRVVVVRGRGELFDSFVVLSTMHMSQVSTTT